MVGVGCIRAAVFKDWRAVLWLDVHWIVPVFIAAEFGLEVVKDVAVWAAHKFGLIKLPQPRVFPTDPDLRQPNPLTVPPQRALRRRDYCFVFGASGSFIFLGFVILLGPRFVFAVCQEFVAGDSNIGLWKSGEFGMPCGGP